MRDGCPVLILFLSWPLEAARPLPSPLFVSLLLSELLWLVHSCKGVQTREKPFGGPKIVLLPTGKSKIQAGID